MVPLKQFKTHQKNKEVDFLIFCLLSYLSLWENMLADKGVIRTGNEIISAGKNFKCHLILRQNFEIQKYYQNEPYFNGAY